MITVVVIVEQIRIPILYARKQQKNIHMKLDMEFCFCSETCARDTTDLRRTGDVAVGKSGLSH